MTGPFVKNHHSSEWWFFNAELTEFQELIEFLKRVIMTKKLIIQMIHPLIEEMVMIIEIILIF